MRDAWCIEIEVPADLDVEAKTELFDAVTEAVYEWEAAQLSKGSYDKNWDTSVTATRKTVPE